MTNPVDKFLSDAITAARDEADDGVTDGAHTRLRLRESLANHGANRRKRFTLIAAVIASLFGSTAFAYWAGWRPPWSAPSVATESHDDDAADHVSMRLPERGRVGSAKAARPETIETITTMEKVPSAVAIPDAGLVAEVAPTPAPPPAPAGTIETSARTSSATSGGAKPVETKPSTTPSVVTHSSTTKPSTTVPVDTRPSSTTSSPGTKSVDTRASTKTVDVKHSPNTSSSGASESGTKSVKTPSATTSSVDVKHSPTSAAPSPGTTSSGGTKSVETPSSTTTSVETTPVETKSVETKSVETKSVETKPVPTAPRVTNQAPRVEASQRSAELAAYRNAHTLHFRGSDPKAALAAWDAYLATYPNGSLAPEARYDRALVLVKLARWAEARAALAPFANGKVGAYRQKEAAEILAAIRDR